jgi:hypothetical protein
VIKIATNNSIIDQNIQIKQTIRKMFLSRDENYRAVDTSYDKAHPSCDIFCFNKFSIGMSQSAEGANPDHGFHFYAR